MAGCSKDGSYRFDSIKGRDLSDPLQDIIIITGTTVLRGQLLVQLSLLDHI
jgi:hypothetical protein